MAGVCCGVREWTGGQEEWRYVTHGCRYLPELAPEGAFRVVVVGRTESSVVHMTPVSSSIDVPPLALDQSSTTHWCTSGC